MKIVLNPFIVASIIIFIYLSLVFSNHRNLLQTTITEENVHSYLHSQDIPHEVFGRVFLSDSEIHLGAAYLYSYGADPTQYNFQHPPFLKYLFGLSNRFLGNPLYPQLLFGISGIILTIMLGIRIFNNLWGSLLAGLLLAIDPLFVNLSGYAMLDLGQMVLLLAFMYAYLFLKKSWIVPGVLLGILASSKFWSVPLFFFTGLLVWGYLQNRLNVHRLILIILTCTTIFIALYLPTFLQRDEFFNIVFFELKTLKYWINHSVTTIPGASLLLYISGLFQTWWGERHIIQENIWSILWPIGLLVSTISGFRLFKKEGVRSERIIVHVVPIVYLIYLGIQAPFVRYFVIILPFIYMSLSIFLVASVRTLVSRYILLTK